MAGTDHAGSLEIEVVKSITGDIVFKEPVLGSCTAAELLSKLSLNEDGVKHILLHPEHGILLDDAVLGAWIQHPGATLTLLKRPFFKVAAKDIAGAHTSNEQYFTRPDKGSQEEYLRLRKVCWFSVGGTFPEVPPGDYTIVIEAKSDRLNLDGKNFDVSAGGEKVGSWDAVAALRDEFGEFEVCCFTQAEPGPVRVQLDMRANWVSGFCWKSIYLR